MATSLEQREQQTNMGQAWTPVLITETKDDQGVTHVVRTRYYDNGKIEEVDGEAWALVEVNAINTFP